MSSWFGTFATLWFRDAASGSSLRTRHTRTDRRKNRSTPVEPTPVDSQEEEER